MSTLLTPEQRQALDSGIERSLAKGVRGKGGPLDMLRRALQTSIGGDAVMNQRGGGAWMRQLARYLLAADDRMRSLPCAQCVSVQGGTNVKTTHAAAFYCPKTATPCGTACRCFTASGWRRA